MRHEIRLAPPDPPNDQGGGDNRNAFDDPVNAEELFSEEPAAEEDPPAGESRPSGETVETD